MVKVIAIAIIIAVCGLSSCTMEKADNLTGTESSVSAQVESPVSSSEEKKEETSASSDEKIEDNSSVSSQGKENIENFDGKDLSSDYDIDSETGLEIFSNMDLGDIDGNGVTEKMIVRESIETGYYSHVAFYFNDKRIFEHEDELLCDPPSAEYNPISYEDYDNDGKKEILITFYPHVNSAPMIEYAVLKQDGDTWKELKTFGKNRMDNAFPVTVNYHEGCMFEIACVGYDNTIVIDANKYYSDKLADEDISDYDAKCIKDILDGKRFEEGDICGATAAWGVWDVEPSTINENRCIVATHGIEGDLGKFDYIGDLEIYFNFTEEGNINILYMNFTAN